MSNALADRVTDFLRDEKTFLQQARAAIDQARALLATPTLDATEQALRIQRDLVQAVEARKGLREAWWGTAAPGEPNRRSFTRILSTLPEPARSNLTNEWRGIKNQAERFSTELKQLLAFIRASVDCYQAFFQDLFRGATTDGRYGPNGRTLPPANVVFVETRG